MDSLTQIVLGAAVGEAVLGRKVGNKAMLYGAIAGTIPDLDTFASYFTDTVTALEIHRGFTHSIVFSILFAPVFGWIISKIERKAEANFYDWSWLMFWGFFTHPILDSFTTWGTRLFWPLDIRLEFKNIFVIDPLYTLPFLVFLIMALRAKKGSQRRKKLNNLGLIVSSAYLVVTLGLKGISYMKFKNALEEQNIEYADLQNKPGPFNTILWTANVETKDAFLIGDYTFLGSGPINFKPYPKNHHLLEDLGYDENVQRLIKVSKGWYIFSEKEGEIYFHDLRFGVVDLKAEEPTFVFTYHLVEEEDGVRIDEVDRNPEDAKQLISVLGDRILGR
ncbi:metal-dependent hydrolase [soil metagenome]